MLAALWGCTKAKMLYNKDDSLQALLMKQYTLPGSVVNIVCKDESRSGYICIMHSYFIFANITYLHS